MKQEQRLGTLREEIAVHALFLENGELQLRSEGRIMMLMSAESDDLLRFLEQHKKERVHEKHDSLCNDA